VGQKLAVGYHAESGSVTQGVKVTAAAKSCKRPTSVGEVSSHIHSRTAPHGACLIDLVLTGPVLTRFWRADGSTILLLAPGQRSRGDRRSPPQRELFSCLTAPRIPDPLQYAELSPSPDRSRNYQVKRAAHRHMVAQSGGQSKYRHHPAPAIHGTIYEFLRNGAMDASTFASMGNNHLVQNNFGASFEGPVHRRKLFSSSTMKACA